jgi:hypothetical protein
MNLELPGPGIGPLPPPAPLPPWRRGPPVAPAGGLAISIGLAFPRAWAGFPFPHQGRSSRFVFGLFPPSPSLSLPPSTRPPYTPFVTTSLSSNSGPSGPCCFCPSYARSIPGKQCVSLLSIVQSVPRSCVITPSSLFLHNRKERTVHSSSVEGMFLASRSCPVCPSCPALPFCLPPHRTGPSTLPRVAFSLHAEE